MGGGDVGTCLTAAAGHHAERGAGHDVSRSLHPRNGVKLLVVEHGQHQKGYCFDLPSTAAGDVVTIGLQCDSHDMAACGNCKTFCSKWLPRHAKSFQHAANFSIIRALALARSEALAVSRRAFLTTLADVSSRGAA